MAESNNVIFKILADTKAYTEGINKTVDITEAATKAMKIGFAALAATFVGSTVAYAKFEASMANIATIVDTSKESIKDMGDEILKMAKDTPKPISELTESLYDIRSAGISADNAFMALKASAKLSVTGLSSVKEATDILTTSMNAFGDEGISANEMANILFKTVNYGKNTVQQLAQNFGATAPIVKSLGMSFKEFNAATAALTAVGVPASVAQNQLRAAMVSLEKPTDQMSKIFHKLGVKDLKDLLKNSANVGDAFNKIRVTAEGMGIPLVEATGRIEGAAAILSLSTSANKTYLKSLQDMESGVDSISEAFAKQSETLMAQKQIMTNMVNAVFINLGSRLQPALIGISSTFIKTFDMINGAITKNGDKITAVFQYISEIGSTVFGVIKNIGIVVANLFEAFGGYQIVAGAVVVLKYFVDGLMIIASVAKTITNAVVGLMNDFGALGTVMKVVLGIMALYQSAAMFGTIMKIVEATKLWKAAMFALNLVMKANPIVLIVSAVVALGAIIYDLIVNFNEWRMSWDKLINNIMIGWTKLKMLMASDESKKQLQAELDELNKQNEAINANTEALKKRKEELKNAGASSFEADRQAGKEFDSGELKAQEAEKTEIKKQGEEQRKQIENEAQANSYESRQKAYNEQKALAESNFMQDMEAAKGNDENKIKARQEYQARLKELDAQFRAENVMLDEERKAVDAENEVLFNEEMLTMKMENGLLEREAMTAQKDQEYQERLEREKQYQDSKLKMGKAYAETERAMNKFYNTEAVKGFQENANTLTRMSDSKNSTLAGIGKSAAMVQIALDTPKAAMSAYSALAGIPLIGPALGIAAAGAAIAYGAEQMQRVKSQSYAVGTDYVPQDMLANIHQGEGIIPAKENQFLQSGKLALMSPDMVNDNQVNSNKEEGGTINNVAVSFDGANIYGDVDESMSLKIADKIASAIHENRFSGFPSPA